MTCTHIADARKFLVKLVGRLRDSSDTTVREDTEPYIVPGSVEPYLDQGFFKSKYGAKWTEKPISVISWSKVEEKINEIDNLLSSCNCYANENIKRGNENARKDDLINHHREERRNLQAQLDDIKKDYKDTTDRQYALIESERRENSLVRTENSKLQKALGLSEAQAKQLEIRLSEKTGELRLKEQALDRLRQAFLDLSIANATNSTRAQVIGEQLDWTKGRLEINDNRIALMEDKLDQKQRQLEDLRQSFSTLQIRYETETGDKDNKLKHKDKEIKLLKSQAGQSQEKFSNEKEHWKEGSLEELAVQLGINLQQIDSLRRYYERLVNARKNYNQNNITTHKGNITRIKQELINGGVSVANTQKVCRKCEKLAELRLELEEVRQQQFEARQEQPTNL